MISFCTKYWISTLFFFLLAGWGGGGGVGKESSIMLKDLGIRIQPEGQQQNRPTNRVYVRGIESPEPVREQSLRRSLKQGSK